MTKGNLNDMIRQEVGKEVESESSPVAPPKRSRETSATLQGRIDELTIALETAATKTKTLQERVNELEGELGEERERLKVERAKEKMALEAAAAKTKKLEERVNELERELAGKNELKPLLEESTALVEKLSGQLRESETELVASRQLVEKLYGQVQQWENRPAPKPAVKKPNLYNFEMRTLARYVAPAPSITELSDTEIGWFD